MRMTLLLAGLLTAGCATQPPVDYASWDAGSIQGATTVTDSRFAKTSTVESPPIRDKVLSVKSDVAAFDRYDERMVLLRGAVAKGAPTRHQAYVEVTYIAQAWRLYRGASLAGGKRTTVIPIERTVVRCGHLGGCEFREAIGVLLDENDLRSAGPLEIRLQSHQGGEYVLSLPRNYVEGYLAAVNGR